MAMSPLPLSISFSKRRNVTDTQQYSVKCIEELDDLAHEWRSFQRDAIGSPFQHFDWINGLVNDLNKLRDARLCLVTIRSRTNEGSLLALLPLMIHPLAGVKALSWLGDDHSNHQGGLYKKAFLEALTPDRFQRLWSRVVSSLPMAVDIVNLRSQAKNLGSLANPIQHLGHNIESANICPQLIFPHHQWTSLAAELRSKKARKRMRNEENRLSREAKIEWRFLEQTDEITRFLPELFRQRRLRFQELGIASEADESQYLNFYKHLLLQSAKRKDTFCRLLIITADGEMIAATLLLQNQDCLYPLLISMTEQRLRQWSPGDYVLRLALQYACDEQLACVDMGPGQQTYKTAWSNHKAEQFETVIGASPKGKVLSYAIRAALHSKRIIKNTPWLWHTFGKLRSIKSSLTGH